MLETARLDGRSQAIDLDFVERVTTPKRLMRLAIHLHLNGLSLSNTVSVIERFGVERARSTVHNWIQKADLKPSGGRDPSKVALDETVVKIDGDRYWLYLAVDPETNKILHHRLCPARNNGLTKWFLREFNEKHNVEHAEFLVDGAPWLHAGLFELGMDFRHETHGDRNPVERIF